MGLVEEETRMLGVDLDPHTVSDLLFSEESEDMKICHDFMSQFLCIRRFVQQ